jgi:hypothetical protein
MSSTKYYTRAVEVPVYKPKVVPVKKPEVIFDPKPPVQDKFVFDPKPPTPDPEMIINVNLAEKGPQEIKVYP